MISSSSLSWSAGASSIDALCGNGWFSFSVPIGSAGVFVGLSEQDKSTLPSEPLLGFMFSSGLFRVEEGGQQRTSDVRYSEGQAFHIACIGRSIYCCYGPPQPHRVGAVSILPGRVIYTHTLQSVPADGFLLDASLLMGGDRVVDASLTIINASSVISMKPMVLSASDDGFNAVDASFPYMWAEADNGRSAHLAMQPMVVAAADASYGAVSVFFEPMELSAADGGPAMNGALLSFEYLTAIGDGTDGNAAASWMQPMDARGGDKDHSEATPSFLPMRVMAYGDKHAGEGLMFSVVVPGLSGAMDAHLDVTDGAFVSDAAYASSYTMVVDGVIVSSDALTGDAPALLVEDGGAVMREQVLLGGGFDADDGLVVGDETMTTDSALNVTDSLAATFDVDAYSDSFAMADGGGAVASGIALPISLLDVSDSMVMADDAVLLGWLDVDDGAVMADDCMVGSEAVSDAPLLESMVAWSETEAQSVTFALLEDNMVMGEQLLMKQPGLVAWVMNTDTGAVCWYDNWAFTSMASVGGKVFAAGPDGLHVLGGELDGNEQIDASVQFGYSEFGGYDKSGQPKPTEQKKRVPALWFGYHAGGELDATVETYGQQYPPYTYSMAQRSAEQPRNSRIQLGRGLSARYWKVAIANTYGCNFEVHSLSAEVAASTRKL